MWERPGKHPDKHRGGVTVECAKCYEEDKTGLARRRAVGDWRGWQHWMVRTGFWEEVAFELAFDNKEELARQGSQGGVSG